MLKTILLRHRWLRFGPCGQGRRLGDRAGGRNTMPSWRCSSSRPSARRRRSCGAWPRSSASSRAGRESKRGPGPIPYPAASAGRPDLEQSMIASAGSSARSASASWLRQGFGRRSARFQGGRSALEHGDPADQIVRAAARHGADLIVMGRRGYGDLKGLLLGSVSHKVCRLADCACLTVKWTFRRD